MTTFSPQIHSAQTLKTAKSRQRVLGKALGRLYESVTREPAPDEFMLLLAQTDARQTARPKN